MIKLPFNLSIITSGVNEGFYFVYGQNFLNEKRSLFIAFYALILKIFGFNTWAIIAVHFLQTFIVFLICLLVFYICKKLMQDDFYGGLSVLFLVLILITPIGKWGHTLELESNFALEAEYFCVLFSLCSIFLLLKSFYSIKNRGKKASFFAGLFACSSLFCKANGAILILAIICLFIYLFIFEFKAFKSIIPKFLLFFSGALTVFILFIIWFYSSETSTNLFSFIQNYFSQGSYKPLNNPFVILKRFWWFLFKYEPACLSNFCLLSLSVLIFVFCFFKCMFKRNINFYERIFILLICTWGIGNVCVILAPGEYGSYYYNLLWPSLVIIIVYGLRDLIFCFTFFKSSVLKIVFVTVISIFFFHRFSMMYQSYVLMLENNLSLSVFSQPQSFQDPVLPYDGQNSKRPPLLQVADVINSYLPDKKDKFYAFNFARGYLTFSPDMYIYAKRLPGASVLSDFLHYKKFVVSTIKKITSDLIKNPPRIIITPVEFDIPEDIPLDVINPFLNRLNSFLKENYHIKKTFEFKQSETFNIQSYIIFEKN